VETLFVVPYGGLGNQLFQISAAMALSSNEIKVLSNWGFARRNSQGNIELESWIWTSRTNFDKSSRGGNFSRRLLNLLLRIGAENHSRVLIKVLEISSAPLFSILLGTKVSVRINRGLGFSKLEVKKRTLLVGYFQSVFFAQSVIDELVKIHPKYMAIRTLGLIEEAISKNILIVHVRRGDYVNEAFGVLSDEYYERALEAIDYRTFEEIWVFSDDIDSAKSILALNEKKSVRFIDDEDLESSEVLEVMRFGKGFIIANSSFSWWAAQLRYDRRARVICPSPWFKFTRSPEGVIDDEWFELSW
jgi:hypothetical protein